MLTSEFLQLYIDKFQFIEAISIYDKEGIQVCLAHKPEKENIVDNAFVEALNQSNDNLSKLNNIKIHSATLFYSNYLVQVQQIQNLIICIFCNLDANIALINEISKDLKNSLEKLERDVEKIRQQ